MLNESLETASHGLSFARKDLLEALEHSSAVQSIIVLELIRKVSELDREVSALLSALESDGGQRE